MPYFKASFRSLADELAGGVIARRARRISCQPRKV
jgi:hypothetical protein